MSAYATTTEADAYFAGRLYSELWLASTPAQKTNSLEQAARIIDRLNFLGEKHAAYLVRVQLTGSSDSDSEICNPADRDAIRTAGATQELQFPRGSDTVIPNDIKIASYEISFALLDGVDPDLELEDQGVVSQGYSSVRVTYDRTKVSEYILSGVPSPVAWRYLKPYLRDGHGVRINRV